MTIISTSFEGTAGTVFDWTAEPTVFYSNAASGVGTYDATHVHSGTMARLISANSGANFNGASHIDGKVFRWREYFYITAAATSDVTLLSIYDSVPTRLLWLRIQGTSRLRFSDLGGTGTQITATDAFPLNEWVRVEVILTVGTTTSNSRIQCAYYHGESTTPIQSWDLTDRNLGTGDMTRTADGVLASTGDSWMDDLAFEASDSGFIGPIPANVAPSVATGAAQYVQAGSVVTLTASSTDSDRTVASLTGAFTTSPGAAPALTGTAKNLGTANASLSQTATLTDPGVYTWTATTTDNGGGTTTGTTSIYVYPAANVDTVLTGADGSSWSNQGGAASLLAALGDSDPATYAQGPDNPSGQALTVSCGPLGSGSLDFYVSGYQSGSGTITRTVTIKTAGGTTIYTTTYQLTSSDAEQHISVDPTGLAMVPNASDRNGLQVIVSDQVS